MDDIEAICIDGSHAVVLKKSEKKGTTQNILYKTQYKYKLIVYMKEKGILGA